MIRINSRLVILLFLTPIFLALFLIYYIRENRRLLMERHVQSGIVALFDGGTVTREDIRTYFQSPPPEESPILRGLEITPEDVSGLEAEDPAWFKEDQGQLLISRLIKHIALLKYFHAQDDSPIQDTLEKEVKTYLELLMLNAIEEELDRIEPDIKQEEMMAYYVDHPQDFHREQKRFARHIMIFDPSSALEIQEASPPASTNILERLRSGEDFQDLIQESQSVTKESAGMLGWSSKGSLSTPFEEALWALDVGEITGPVPVDNTLHFIQLLDEQKEELLPFRQCREQICEILQKQKKQAHRYKLLKLSPEAMKTPDPSLTGEYRTLLLQAAYERKLDQDPKLRQRTDIFANYRKADLLFNDFREKNENRRSNSEPESGLTYEIEAIKKLIKKIRFQLLVKLDVPQTETPAEYE